MLFNRRIYEFFYAQSRAMRLLDTATGEFHWIDAPHEKPYAILSHTWGATGEQSFQDVIRLQDASRKTQVSSDGHAASEVSPSVDTAPTRTRIPTSHTVLASPDISPKVKAVCATARAYGYELVWVDSCCIDKSSSAELTEAINSMYEWYRHAQVCYVYLEDVDDDDIPAAEQSQFRRARWHSRSWTLQELVAPRYVVFFSKGWRVLGTKTTLCDIVEEVTGIDRAVLNHERPLQSVSVARRMWWASARETTRVEDEAYSLLGIFGINMPTIYGEGRNAFVRLQEEIIKVVPDQSIFCWALRRDHTEHHPIQDAARSKFWQMLHHEHRQTHTQYEELQVMLASSPSAFANCAEVRVVPHAEFLRLLGVQRSKDDPAPHPAMTSAGVRLWLPIIPIMTFPSPFPNNPDPANKLREIVFNASSTHHGLAILECKDDADRLLALPLHKLAASEYGVGITQYPWRVIALEPDDLRQCLPNIVFEEVLIRRRPSRQSVVVSTAHSMFESHDPGLAEVRLHGWCRALLAQQGFSASQSVQESSIIATHSRRLRLPNFLYGYDNKDIPDTWEEAARRHKDHLLVLAAHSTQERVTLRIGTHYSTDSLVLAVRYRTPDADANANSHDGKVTFAEGSPQPFSTPDGTRYPISDGVMWVSFALEDRGKARRLRLSFARSAHDHRVLELAVELSDVYSMSSTSL